MGTSVSLLAALAGVVGVLVVRLVDRDRALDGEGVGSKVISLVLLIGLGGLVTAGHSVDAVELVGDLLVVSSSVGVGSTA